MKINLWPLFFGSCMPLPLVITATTHYGWVIAWVALCLAVCIGYEIIYKIKHKKT
jgi:hypothetical protein